MFFCRHITVSIAYCVLTVFLAYGIVRANFSALIAAYTLLFALYGFILCRQYQKGASITQFPFLHYTRQNTLFYYILLGLLLRVVLLFSIPNLSEDAWRFLWDGRLITNGIHPFSYPPVYFIEHHWFPKGITPELYAHLNSKQWFSVYPPVCQAIFTIAAWLSPVNDYWGIVWMKFFLLLCETGTIWLLWQSKKHLAALIWALNPLVLLEIMGNCHFEGALVFFLLLSLRLLQQGRVRVAGVALAFSVCVKLWPLMFAPLVFRWLGLRRGSWFGAIFLAVTVALFLPLLHWAVLQNMGKSLDLYFQKFSFNSSVYYIFWEIGLQFQYYKLDKLVGLLLVPFPIMAVVYFSLRLSPKYPVDHLFCAILCTFCIYLFFTSTVHPWYVIVLLALGLWAGDAPKNMENAASTAPQERTLSQWPIPFFPMVWSGMVMLSYSHYAHGAFLEQKGLIALEYMVVLGFLIWDYVRRAYLCASLANLNNTAGIVKNKPF